MKLLSWGKDGGEESHVWGFYLIEVKKLFSIVLLNFKDGSRDTYHSHAFSAVSWLLRGQLREMTLDQQLCNYDPSWKPIYTPRTRFHQVRSIGSSWVLSFRGRWSKTWEEFLPEVEEFITLTNGRKRV